MRHIAAIVLLSTACASADVSERADTSSSPGMDSPAGTNAAATGATQEIYIDSVTAENPLILYGRARTFENTVQVRVRDAAGEQMSEVFTTSVGEMGNHNPFLARVWLTRPPGDHVIVESFEYSANDGSVRSLTADTVRFDSPDMTLTLDFPTDECTATVAIRRSAPRTVAMARLLVEALVAGPDSSERASGANGVFPRGARVESVILRQGELTVDFNERLQNVGGSCAAQAIRASVTRTLRRLPSVRRVIITAAGSADLALQP